MTVIDPPAVQPAAQPEVQRHALILRLAHWLTAVAIFVMVGSGWRIYDASPFLPIDFGFPYQYTIGGDFLVSEAAHNEDGLANALAWHFAGMWLLFASTATMLLYGFISGHYRRDWLPVWPRQIFKDFIAAATFRLQHRLGQYNAVQKAMYWGALSAMLLMILTGLAIWKPVQFQELTWLFGGYESARIVHFLGMSAIVAFVLIHVTLVIVVPRTLIAMIVGKVSAPGHATNSAGEHR